MDIISNCEMGQPQRAHVIVLKFPLSVTFQVEVHTCVGIRRSHCRRWLGDKGWDGGQGACSCWGEDVSRWDSHVLRLMEMVKGVEGHHCIRSHHPLAWMHLGVVPIYVGSCAAHLLHHIKKIKIK